MQEFAETSADPVLHRIGQKASGSSLPQVYLTRPLCRKWSAISSGCETHAADRSSGEWQPESASQGQNAGVLLLVGTSARPPNSVKNLICVPQTVGRESENGDWLRRTLGLAADFRLPMVPVHLFGR